MFKKINIVAAAALVSLLLAVSVHADYDTFSVNVPNAQGGYTAIILKKTADGYIGPQGELYSSFPSVYQLQVIYKLGNPPEISTPAAPEPVQQAIPQPEQAQAFPDGYLPPTGYPAPEVDPYDDGVGYYAPVAEPPVTEIMAPAGPVEEGRITFFEFKKKKKSRHDDDHDGDHHDSHHDDKHFVPAPGQMNNTNTSNNHDHNHDHDHDHDRAQ